MSEFPSLESVLAFDPPDEILSRYQLDYPDNKLSARAAFSEAMKFLWCSQLLNKLQKEDPDNQDLKFDFVMHHEMGDIDDMWHTFILFTRQYTEFSKEYFGYYLHHAPTTELEKKEFYHRFDDFINIDTKRMLSFVYDHLGEDTLRTWFSSYFN